MLGGPRDAILQDSIVAQVSAALYYQANVIAKFTNNAAFKKTFKDVISNQIIKDLTTRLEKLEN